MDEYFRLWGQAAAWAPEFCRVYDVPASSRSVLVPALVRDLILRVCYLECAERRLSQTPAPSEDELVHFRHDCPAHLYRNWIEGSARRQHVSEDQFAVDVRVDRKTLQRIKSGEQRPTLQLLRRILPPGTSPRLPAGIAYFDWLLKKLKLDKSPLHKEFLVVASILFRHYPPAMEAVRRKSLLGKPPQKYLKWEHYVSQGDGLLLHPGLEDLSDHMPNDLWRIHLATLQLARIHDLARLYSIQADPELQDRL